MTRKHKITIMFSFWLAAWLLGLIGGCVAFLFRLEEITIIAPTPEIGEEVRRQLQVPTRACLLSLSLSRLCEQAQACYRVEKVHVERKLPHTLNILVEIRQPLAALRDDKGYTLVSREGLCLYRQAKRPALPVFIGLAPSRPPLGSRIAPMRWQWALDLLAGATKAGLRENLEADFSELHYITVRTAEGWEANLGNVNSLTRKMAILGRLAKQLQNEGRRIKSIDVSVPECPIWTAI